MSQELPTLEQVFQHGYAAGLAGAHILQSPYYKQECTPGALEISLETWQVLSEQWADGRQAGEADRRMMSQAAERRGRHVPV